MVVVVVHWHVIVDYLVRVQFEEVGVEVEDLVLLKGRRALTLIP